MSRGTLSFKLPEESEEFELAQDGWKYKCAMDDVLAELRSKSKYEDKDSLTIDEIREIIAECLAEYDL